MKYSVIVPVYNVEKYLPHCVDSIISQIKDINSDIEILLIDDGSTDKSAEICDQYKKMNPEVIKVFHNKNRGLLLTRRFGFEKAQGEYIVNCDSDDFLEPCFFETIDRVLDEFESDVVIFNAYRYCEDSKSVFINNIFGKANRVVQKEEVLREFLSTYMITSMWIKVYKRSCVCVNKDYNQFDYIQNGEDTLQTIEIFDNAKSFYYVNQQLYNYRQGSGMTTKFDSKYIRSFIDVYKIMEQYSIKWEIKEYEDLISQRVLSAVGRAITISRFGNLRYAEWKKYLININEDEFICRYKAYFVKVYKKLQADYRFLLPTLFLKFYFVLITVLKMKRIVDKR